LRRDFVEHALWKKLRADDHFFYGGSGKHKLRYKQHTELGGNRSDESCHHAGDIHVHIGKRFNEHEPNGDDHLHSDGNQRRWLDHVYANSYCKHCQQTSDQLFHGQPHRYYFRLQQYVGLGDDRGDQSCHHSRNIHFHIREWVDERESIRDNHLHADCHQRLGLDHINGKGQCHSVRWFIGDHNHFVPGRHTRREICRLHNRRQRWLSPLQLFREHEFQLFSAT
jgi:hypothetical protein